jgi:hypothetical protein
MDVEEYTIDDKEDQPRSRRMEMVLGLALVAAVLGFVLFNYVRQEMQVGHYHAGIDALDNREPELAIGELQAADAYLDSAALIETARARIEARDALYKQATELASVGKWWRVARTLLKMQEVQKSHKDSDALLARAREVNGPIFYTHTPPDGIFKDGTRYYTYDAPDKTGIYVIQADGEYGQRIENTERWMPTYAVSPDGRSLVYSLPSGPARLYNSTSQSVTRLALPATSSSTAIQKADFTPDSNTLILRTADTAFSYDIRQVSAGDMEKIEPVSQESRAEYDSKQVKTLTLLTNAQQMIEVAIRVYTSTSPLVLATERGTVDGALFTKDQRYLMYRVCEFTSGNRTFECALKLADLTSQDLEVQTIATIPNLTLSAYDEGLLGEFTQDGEHILLFIEYRGDAETLVYDIATGETSKIEPDLFAVTTGRGKRDVYVVGTDYLLDDYVPGLQSWQGRNSLGRTAQNLRRPTDRHTKVKSHWVTITPNNRFVLSLNSHITESTRYYRLSVAPLTWNSAEAPDGGRTLFSTKALPREWLPSARILADSYTLIASPTLDSSYIPDIHAYSLDGESEPDVTLVEAAHLLDLYSFPEEK